MIIIGESSDGSLQAQKSGNPEAVLCVSHVTDFFCAIFFSSHYATPAMVSIGQVLRQINCRRVPLQQDEKLRRETGAAVNAVVPVIFAEKVT